MRAKVCYYTGKIIPGLIDDDELALLKTMRGILRDPRDQGGIAWLINLAHRKRTNLIPVEVSKGAYS